jgi:hypothetical protein
MFLQHTPHEVTSLQNADFMICFIDVVHHACLYQTSLNMQQCPCRSVNTLHPAAILTLKSPVPAHFFNLMEIVEMMPAVKTAGMRGRGLYILRADRKC